MTAELGFINCSVDSLSGLLADSSHQDEFKITSYQRDSLQDLEQNNLRVTSVYNKKIHTYFEYTSLEYGELNVLTAGGIEGKQINIIQLLNDFEVYIE